VADKSEFVARAARTLQYPPYFKTMEQLNVKGPPVLGALPAPPPLSAEEFEARAAGAQVLDVRSETAFGCAHVPGALSIWEEGLPRYAGWFLSYDKPVLLVAEAVDVSRAVRFLIRLGFDRLDGFLSGGMHAWLAAGFESHRIGTVTVQGLCRRLDADENVWILDVRSEEEVAREKGIPGAHHRHLTELPQHLDEVPTDRPVCLFCGTGLRAMIGASLLRRAGWENVTDVLGGIAGWNSVSCPLE
jgi:hydroxyacylglutathione hydrolase